MKRPVEFARRHFLLEIVQTAVMLIIDRIGLSRLSLTSRCVYVDWIQLKLLSRKAVLKQFLKVKWEVVNYFP